ncbi:MAG: putative ATP-dependent RNA helicase ddx46, partial [Paramarteilia canceri]
MSWLECGLSSKVLYYIQKTLNFQKPTPIQSQAIPSILSGRDVIGLAKTGSGKTLAFVLPMIRHVMDQRPVEPGEGPIGLILEPTRELALQTAREVRRFAKLHKIPTLCVYGGTNISEQIAEIKSTLPRILIATPGRLIDMLAANSGRVMNLHRCTFTVLDEADRMFDMGFEPQVMLILDSARPDKQTLLFSATFPSQMETLARLVLKKPIEVSVGAKSVVASDISQNVHVLEDESQKVLKLLEILGIYITQGSALIFVEKQESCDILAKQLKNFHYPCAALHAGVDQYDRDSILEDFRTGVIDLMIATSIAARGLDVKNLILVVNFDCPNHYEDYVHRCGRTGRAGNKGYAHTFLTYDDGPKSLEIIKALTVAKLDVPESLKKLWQTYKDDMEQQGKKIKMKSSGFSGRGFRFDENEAQLVMDRKKFQKNVLGIQDGSDDECLNIDEQIEQIFATKSSSKNVKDASKSGFYVKENVLLPHGYHRPKIDESEALDVARKIAQRIQTTKLKSAEDEDNDEDETSATQKTATAILKGYLVDQPEVSKKMMAKQLAEKIEKVKGFSASNAPILEPVDNGIKSTEIFETELEINDFPQNVRFKITCKETLDNIMEYADVYMSVKGIYCPPKRKDQGIEPSERPLYMHIESQSEMNIQKAKSELVRIIKEELVRLQTSYIPSMGGSKGRYK